MSSECTAAAPEELREFMDPKVVKALDAGLCTFTVHGAVPIRQNYRWCKTCWRDPDSGACICLSCASKCHSGHELGPMDGPG